MIRARFATYEDLIAVPENMVAELIDGELYASPRPPGPHIRARSALGGLIGPPFDFGKGGPGGWWILFQPELHFGRDVLVPDLAGWRKERMPQIPTGHFYVVPDWVCEVISPSSERLDRLKKMPIYAREGVPFAWFVDPLQQLLSARKLQEGEWILREYGADKLRVEPFEAIEIEMSHVWA
ncbi:MAG TPA: Uma2 family endonuclease [Thermoanaerobaculia bacterium]|nr:Uma2 family endonuclease [Thermoanaerobaculia bacterium]